MTGPATPLDPFSLLDSAARRRPRGAAVRCGSLDLTYGGLSALCGRITEAFGRAGTAPGDRIAALFPNCHLFLATYFAALGSRLILVPLSLRLSAGEIRAILDDAGARVLIGSPALLDRLVPGAAPRAAGEGWTVVAGAEAGGAGTVPAAAIAPPEGAAHLYYTSGTTGRPKGVVLTVANLAAHVEMTLAELSFTERDVWLHAAPMFHLADAWAVWTATAAAATHVMLERYDPAAALDLIVRTGVTITNLVPTMIPGLLAEAERRGDPLRSLRLLLSGGAPIAPRLVSRIGDLLGCDYVQTYGLTETSPFLTFSFLDEDSKRLPADERMRLRARTGRAARGVELRVVRPPGAGRFEDVPADDATVGEVVARGPTVTPGYWRDEAMTREAFLGGWFHTGDLGTIDRRGSLNLVDRAKDVIITGGETVYSTEVEHVLSEHPGVLEAAVFGIPDETWGESVRAAVVSSPAGAASAERLIAFCRERIAHYKCPRAVDLVAALPRTGSGKIDKRALREPFWCGRARRIN